MRMGWLGAAAGLAAVGAVVAARRIFNAPDDGPDGAVPHTHGTGGFTPGRVSTLRCWKSWRAQTTSSQLSTSVKAMLSA